MFRKLAVPSLLALALTPVALMGTNSSPKEVAQPSSSVTRTLRLNTDGTLTLVSLKAAEAEVTYPSASAAELRSGDTVLLKRGRTYRTTLNIEADHVKIKARGHGHRMPRLTGLSNSNGCVVIDGDYVTLKNVKITNCGSTGVIINGDHAHLTQDKVMHQGVGVQVNPSADSVLIEHSVFKNNDHMMTNTQCQSSGQGCNDDWGAEGVNLQGTNAQVMNNYFEHNVAPSYDYGVDGSAVEVWQAQNSLVANNTASNEIVFSELGGHDVNANHNVFRNNTLTSDLPGAIFFMTRGNGDYFGPVLDTVLDGNHGYLRGSKSVALNCSPGCSPSVLTATNNTFLGEGAAYELGSNGGGNNVYCGTWTDFVRRQPGDRVINLSSVSASYEQLKAQCK